MYHNAIERNPVLTINGLKIGIIGDVHIGKTFRTGVPKNRLGERESMILNQLTGLLSREVDYVVLVGDLFDKVRVSNSDLYNLISIIEKVVMANPQINYIILNGNHDMPKEVDRISSFQLFGKYFERNSFPNLKIISKHNDSNIVQLDSYDTVLYFTHYNAFQALDEEVDTKVINDIVTKYEHRVAFGHWETIDFGSDHFIGRTVPKLVLDSFNYVVTGHEHKPKVTLIQDIPVLTSGSMQPYAYGEELDTEKEFYYTLSIKEVVTLLKKDPTVFANSYVRILVEADQELPPQFECLGRTYKNTTALLKKVTADTSKQTTTSSEPINFQKSFLNLVKQLKESSPESSDTLSVIEKTFLDKAYKENT